MNGDLIKRDDFKVNKEGSFSITRPYESYQIVEIMQECVGTLKDLIITDSTACMGGDTISFSKVCRFVNSVEIDKDNFKCLLENCKRFNCQNVNPFCDDYLNICDSLFQDIIYMDPPWGGIDYKTKKEVKLKLGNIELKTILGDIRKNKLAKYVFVKIPLNMCLDFIRYDDIRVIYNKGKSETFKLLIIYSERG